MKANILSSTVLLAILSVAGCKSGGAAEGGAAADDGSVSLLDPAGDDNGPGTYVYPTDQVYKKGAFDLRSLEVVPVGNDIEFRVKVEGRIEDPWDSKAWGGNGFSVQMAFIHIDMDHAPGSGVQVGLTGTNVRFAPEEAWDKVVIISPQGPTRVNSEVDQKAADYKANVIVPKITRASGKTLIAVVGKEQLGSMPAKGWGYQVLMQSNEGFPTKTDLLTRKVNEFEGQHRFGGGTDFDNDPQVIDILMPPAKGTAAEADAQHAALSKYNKESTGTIEDGTIKPEDWAVVPMVYPGQ
ncbi:MAG: hypothetical protein H6730_19205 [Deltaproteobacteria bacterium]|nr:hypothetical protein [Deltaproteobacteria bacterium]